MTGLILTVLVICAVPALVLLTLSVVLVVTHRPEYADQLKAVRNHGDAMRYQLDQHPEQRLVGYFEPGTTPHELIYDPNDHSVGAVVKMVRASKFIEMQGCDVHGAIVQPDFYDLALDCHG